MATCPGNPTASAARIAGLSCLLTLLLTLLAAPARAQSVDPQLLAQLDSPRYLERHRATRQLLLDDRLTPQAIADAFALATSFEQRHRLLNVARHHMLRLIQQEQKGQGDDVGGGAIGFAPAPVVYSHDGGNKLAMRVVYTFPGFPGYAHLEVGDLITAVDGRELTSGMSLPDARSSFIEHIKNAGAGGSVSLTLLRSQQEVQVRFRLASKLWLDRIYGPAGTPDGTFMHPYMGQWLSYYNGLLSPHLTSIKIESPPDQAALGVEP